MKKIKSILTVTAFAVAIVGAFAFSNYEVQTDYWFPGTNNLCEMKVRPDACGSLSGPICTIAGQTYYDNKHPVTGQCLQALNFN